MRLAYRIATLRIILHKMALFVMLRTPNKCLFLILWNA